MNKQIELIIADDHQLFVNGLRLLLEDVPWIHVLDIADNGRALLHLTDRVVPDIILLDINMPVLNGLDVMKQLKQSRPSIKVIFLSTYNDEHLIEQARLYGANGYLLKNCSKEELLEAIEQVMQNKDSFPHKLPVLNNEFDSNEGFLKQFNLTKRERHILQLLKQGLTNQQIAGDLFLSIYTIETHRKNIMQKLGLKTPLSLMQFIYKHGL